MDTAEPNPSISGTVPRLKQNIDKAPAIKFPDASATTCMDCSGPHGIKPLQSPMKNGVLGFLPDFCFVFLLKFGICIVSFLSPGKIPSIFMPITTMIIPANNLSIPWKNVDVCKLLPIPANAPTPPITPPITVYESTRPVLYSRVFRNMALEISVDVSFCNV